MSDEEAAAIREKARGEFDAVAKDIRRISGEDPTRVMREMQRRGWQRVSPLAAVFADIVASQSDASSLLFLININDWGLCALAAERLGAAGHGAPQALEALLRALQIPHEGLRVAVLRALGRVGLANDEVAQAIDACLGDTSRTVRKAAIALLGELRLFTSERAIRAALADLRLGDDQTRAEGARRLAEIGDPGQAGLEALEHALDDAAAPVRGAALASFRHLGLFTSERAIRVGLADLRLGDAPTRAEGARRLAEIGDPGQAGLEALEHALDDPAVLVRSAALESLRHLGLLTSERAIRAALAHLCLGDDRTRAEGARWLAETEDLGQAGLEALEHALDDPAALVRSAALESLRHLGLLTSERAIRAALADLRLGDDRTRAEGGRRLAEIGDPGQAGLEALEHALADSCNSVRQAALLSLQRLGLANREHAVSKYIIDLRDQDAQVRKAAINALTDLGPQGSRAVPALLELCGQKCVDLHRSPVQIRPPVLLELGAAIPGHPGDSMPDIWDEGYDITEEEAVAIRQEAEIETTMITKALRMITGEEHKPQ